MRELLLSVGAKDCRWDYFRGSGAGGQKKNKTASAVRCTHIASGAVGQASDTRSQPQNRKLAFGRMARSRVFQKWLKVANARAMGRVADIDREVERGMEDRNLRVEGKEGGKWVPLSYDLREGGRN